MCKEQKSLLKKLVADLVSANFDMIVSDGRNGRLSLTDIKDALDDYPGTPTPVPESAFDGARYYPRTNHEDTLGHAEMDLWFDGEVSDLTLSVKYALRDKKWHISVDDIHVL